MTDVCVCSAVQTDRLKRMRGEERVRGRLDEEETDHTSADAIITKYGI